MYAQQIIHQISFQSKQTKESSKNIWNIILDAFQKQAIPEYYYKLGKI